MKFKRKKERRQRLQAIDMPNDNYLYSLLLKKYFIEKNKYRLKEIINKKKDKKISNVATCKIRINESLLIKGIF